MDITEFKGNKEGMEKRLVDHIKEAIQEQETDGNKIEWLYIGKTYVDKDKRNPFNHMNPGTWKTNGIADRWIPHQDNPEIPSDGMVVLCAFTKEHLPDHSRRSQEFLAIAMEQRLIQHFQIFDTERKLVNDSFNQGGTSDHTNESVNTTTSFNADDTTIIAIDPALNISSRDPPTPNHHAYVLYMTYAYKEKTSAGEGTPGKEDESSPSKQDSSMTDKQPKYEGPAGTKRKKFPSHSPPPNESTTPPPNESTTPPPNESTTPPPNESASRPLRSSTPISSMKQSTSSPTSASSSKRNDPLSTVRTDLLPALVAT